MTRKEVAKDVDRRVNGGESKRSIYSTYAMTGCETLAVEGGATFVRTLVRDPYRRDLVMAVVNSQGANYAYSYDALSRPVTRNADIFAYNFRSEVIGANVAGRCESYDYDNIGNSTCAAFNSVTNLYAANGLNQYVSVTSDSEVVEPVYDEDGNMVAYGPWLYAYDSVGRLTTVSSNGLVLAMNYYDHRGRRVRLITSEASYTFIYDGWNVVLELVEHDGVRDRIEYFWGKDISGSLQGAGGVGGLLYLKRNGSIFVPIYDAYGNVMEYRAADGSLAASYVYDAFGRTVSQDGPLADSFRFRYSTKSFEHETGLYYYGRRFYSVSLMRWLSRDPIEERGGKNLYAFCQNSIFKFDAIGLSGWSFSALPYSIEDPDYSPGLRVLVSYEMYPAERKCCKAVIVIRYVRMKRGNGGLTGDYELDQTEDQSWVDVDNPHIGKAPLDNPEGPGGFYLPGIGLYRKEWRWDFLFKAKCIRGADAGKILSTAQKYYYAEGHWDGNNFNGHFYEK